MTASVACSILIRLTLGSPLDEAGDDIDAYSAEFEAFWLELRAWTLREGIVPFMAPPAGWWGPTAAMRVRLEDMVKVVKYLRDKGVTVADCGDLEWSENAEHR